MRLIMGPYRLCALLSILFPTLLAAGQALPIAPSLQATTPLSGMSASAQPTVIVGDPGVPDFPTPFDAINANAPDSPLAGVVSVYGASSSSNGFLGSGVALDRYHIITAAHVIDFAGGITPEGQPTGDGTPDALKPYSRIYYNSTAAPDPISIASIQVSPEWHGFRNANDPAGPDSHGDIAILTLTSPLPDSVPTYPIYRTPFENDTGKIILMTGYGGGGDEVNGVTQPASFDIKRFGWNIAATYEIATNSSHAELYLADFDPSDPDGNPDITHLGFDNFASLGNDFESIIAPGDSGGAAFIIDDKNNNGEVEADELTLFGLTTLTFDTTDGNWPHYGAGFGGPIMSAYAGFIDAAVPVPEAGTLTMLAAGTLLMGRRRKTNAPQSIPGFQ